MLHFMFRTTTQKTCHDEIAQILTSHLFEFFAQFYVPYKYRHLYNISNLFIFCFLKLMLLIQSINIFLKYVSTPHTLKNQNVADTVNTFF